MDEPARGSTSRTSTRRRVRREPLQVVRSTPAPLDEKRGGLLTLVFQQNLKLQKGRRRRRSAA